MKGCNGKKSASDSLIFMKKKQIVYCTIILISFIPYNLLFTFLVFYLYLFYFYFISSISEQFYRWHIFCLFWFLLHASFCQNKTSKYLKLKWLIFLKLHLKIYHLKDKFVLKHLCQNYCLTDVLTFLFEERCFCFQRSQVP